MGRQSPPVNLHNVTLCDIYRDRMERMDPSMENDIWFCSEGHLVSALLHVGAGDHRAKL